MANCETCLDKGWVESNGSPENDERLEIQMCQDCYACESDNQAYELASQEIDTSKHFYDIYVRPINLRRE
tara:strand:- start:330 stop:539 length:210 start_codon:yes stop_codon:yes gene_type:complete